MSIYTAESFTAAVKELQKVLNLDAITQTEFDTRRAELIKMVGAPAALNGSIYTAENFTTAVQELQKVLNSGAITQAEFDTRRAELIKMVGAPVAGGGGGGDTADVVAATHAITSAKQTGHRGSQVGCAVDDEPQEERTQKCERRGEESPVAASELPALQPARPSDRHLESCKMRTTDAIDLCHRTIQQLDSRIRSGHGSYPLGAGGIGALMRRNAPEYSVYRSTAASVPLSEILRRLEKKGLVRLGRDKQDSQLTVEAYVAPVKSRRVFVGGVSKETQREIYVGGVRKGTQRDQIYDCFSAFGKVTNVAMYTGFAFVTFEKHRSAESAVLKYNGRSLFGVKVRVEYRQSRKGNQSKTTTLRSRNRPQSHQISSLSSAPQQWEGVRTGAEASVSGAYDDVAPELLPFTETFEYQQKKKERALRFGTSDERRRDIGGRGGGALPSQSGARGETGSELLQPTGETASTLGLEVQDCEEETPRRKRRDQRFVDLEAPSNPRMPSPGTSGAAYNVGNADKRDLGEDVSRPMKRVRQSNSNASETAVLKDSEGARSSTTEGRADRQCADGEQGELDVAGTKLHRDSAVVAESSDGAEARFSF